MPPRTPRSRTDESSWLEELRLLDDGALRRGVLTAAHGGVEYQLRVLPKQQGFVVSVACRDAGRFRITRKGPLDRWMAGFVPALDFHSHDASFDRGFNVHTRDLRLAAGVLTRKPNRAAVRRLFDGGVQGVRVAGGRVECTCPRKASAGKPAAEDVLGPVEALAVIADAVTAAGAHQGQRASSSDDPGLVGSWTALGLLGVAGLALVIGGAAQYTPVQPGRFLLPCALFGLPAVAPVVYALTLAVRGRTAPYGLVRGLAGLSLVVVPLFVSGALLVANGLFDGSGPAEHVVTVVETKIRKDKGDRSYHAALASWWTADDVRWVRVSRATYEALLPNVSRMRVRTHPGRLGYEWIADYSAAP